MLAHTKTEAYKGFSHISPVLRVSDLSRSLGFYRDQLGFAVEFVYESFYAGVIRDGCHIHLKCSSAAPRDQSALKREEHIDVCIGVYNAAALAESFALAGVPLVVPLRQMPYGREFYIRDPDGYVLGFVETTSSST
jgi:catechol 2,3-dioxygenase-like lactoylglutathione lyase family enzyme